MLLVIVVALTIAVIVLAATRPKTQTIETQKYCFKSHCLLAASEILDSIDPTVNPCDDFYKHSCDTWIKSHRISPDQKSIGTFNTVRRTVSDRIIALLQESSTKDEAIAIRKAKKLFRSCMDLNSIEHKSEDIIKESIQQMKNASNYVDLISLLMSVNANALIPTFVGEDPKNVSTNILTLYYIPMILKSKAYYNKTSPVFIAFKNMIEGFSDVLFPNMTEKIIDFEWRLKDIYPTFHSNASYNYNIIKIGDLQNRTKNQVDWLHIYEKALNMSGIETKIDENTKILVYFPEYIEKLADLLNATDLDTLINYAINRYMMKKINAMPVKYRNLVHLLRKAMLLTKVPKPREKVCADHVQTILPRAVSRLYVDSYFPDTSKKQAIDLVLSLRNSLEKMFQETQWMDDETRTAAIAKVESVLPFIGYDDSIKNNTILDTNYKIMNFTEDNFMRNLITIDRLYGRAAFYGLKIHNKRSSWGSKNAAIVNAFYEPLKNSIFFPAGILQAPFYDSQYPLSMLFGAMGAVVGHEFTHGFDNLGSQYDKDGNLKNWWTTKSMEQFKKHADGLKKEYANFPICQNSKCDLRINENRTLGENIADNGGVKAAFRAYKTYIKNHNLQTKLLPGLTYTSDQLFFVGFAHIWCRKIQPEALIDQLLTNPHSPADARVIVTLRNSEYFAKAFNCKKNSPMNPTIKYGVW